MENALSNNVIALLSCLPASVHFASLSRTVSKEKEAEVTTEISRESVTFSVWFTAD